MREGDPTRVGVSVADIGAGMHAYSAVLEAVMARDMAVVAEEGEGEGEKEEEGEKEGEGEGETEKEKEKEKAEETEEGQASTGTGVTIEVSLFSSVADWMNVPYLHHEASP